MYVNIFAIAKRLFQIFFFDTQNKAANEKLLVCSWVRKSSMTLTELCLLVFMCQFIVLMQHNWETEIIWLTALALYWYCVKSSVSVRICLEHIREERSLSREVLLAQSRVLVLSQCTRVLYWINLCCFLLADLWCFYVLLLPQTCLKYSAINSESSKKTYRRLKLFFSGE